MLPLCRSTSTLRTFWLSSHGMVSIPEFGLFLSRCASHVTVSWVLPRPMTIIRLCSQCEVLCLTLVIDCSSGSRWKWSARCQRREEFYPTIQQAPRSVVPNLFVHGPLSIMGRLYGWEGVSLPSLPGSGSQSCLSCPLISLALAAAKRARGVLPYSKRPRSSVPDVQRDFWSSQASQTIQLYRDHFQSLTRDSEIARALQSGWSGGQHVPAGVQGLCSPRKIVSALLSACSCFDLDAAVDTQGGSEGCVQPARNHRSDHANPRVGFPTVPHVSLSTRNSV